MLTCLFGKTMTYDGENRPVSVSHQGDTTSYTYGPDGQRLKKDVTSLGSTLFAGAVEVRDYDTAAETVAFFPHEDIRIVDGTTSYVHRDHLASVRSITDATSDEELYMSYTPFGLESKDTTTALNPLFSTFIPNNYSTRTGSGLSLQTRTNRGTSLKADIHIR